MWLHALNKISVDLYSVPNEHISARHHLILLLLFIIITIITIIIITQSVNY